jgi:D-amino-acid dehydrogenase
MSQTDVLIIGGGVIGVCTAHYLAERGCQVTLVEQGSIGSGCSYGNSGLIVPSYIVPLASPGALAAGLQWLLDPAAPFFVKLRLDPDFLLWLLKFTLHCTPAHVERSRSILRDLGCASRLLFDELTQLVDCGFEPGGVLTLYNTREGFRRGIEEAQMLGLNGFKTQLLDADAARAMEPAVGPGVVGGLFCATDAHFTPHRFVRGLAARLEDQNVRLQTNTRVLGFEKKDGRIRTVRTTRGDFQPDTVILAAGSWSPALVRSLDLSIPIQAAKGYSLTFPQPNVCPAIPLLLDEAHVGVTPMTSPSGPVLRLGGTLELAGLERLIHLRRVTAIRRAAQTYLTGLDRVEKMELWAGLRPCTPDGLPILGRPYALHNLIVASGHAMLGMSLGPVTGKLVAQLTCGETPDLDLRPFRLERFW